MNLESWTQGEVNLHKLKKSQLVLVGAKLTKLQEKHIHMPHRGLDLERVTIFFP